MTKTLTLVWYFYRPLLLVNLIFSAAGIWNLYKTRPSFIPITIFLKLVGYACTGAYQHYFNSKSYLYYLNAGYSIKKMYGYTFSFDLAIYFVMVVCLYLIKWIGSL